MIPCRPGKQGAAALSARWRHGAGFLRAWCDDPAPPVSDLAIAKDHRTVAPWRVSENLDEARSRQSRPAAMLLAEPAAFILTSALVGVVIVILLVVFHAGLVEERGALHLWIAGDVALTGYRVLTLLQPGVLGTHYSGFEFITPAVAFYGGTSAIALAVALHGAGLARLAGRTCSWQTLVAVILAAPLVYFTVSASLGTDARRMIWLLGFIASASLCQAVVIRPILWRYRGTRMLAATLLGLAILNTMSAIHLGQHPVPLVSGGPSLPPVRGLIVDFAAALLLTLSLMLTLQERLREKILHLSTTDPLTGALNRRGAWPLLAREWERTLRYRRPLSVALMDLDHFKAVNDRFGHAKGDEVLAACVHALKRQPDLLARWGGEEFLLAMPETGRREAWHLVDRIRRAVQENPLAPHLPVVTVSAGVADVRAGEERASLQDLINIADQSLYRAKERRNCVIASSEPDGSAPPVGLLVSIAFRNSRGGRLPRMRAVRQAKMSPLLHASSTFRWAALWRCWTAIVFGALTLGTAPCQAAQSSLSEDLARLYEAFARDDHTVTASLREQVITARAAGDKRRELAARRNLALLVGDDDASLANAISLAGELKDDETAVLLAAARGKSLAFKGDLSGELIARRALEDAQANELHAVLPYVYVINAKIQNRLTRSGEAIELLRPAYQAFVAQKNRVCIALTLDDMAASLRAPETATSEDLATADNYLAEARQLVNAPNERGLLLQLLQGSALTAQRRGDMQAALRHLNAARALVTGGVRPSETGWLDQRTGSVLLAMGRPREALAAFQRALPRLERDNDTLLVSFTLLGLAEAYSTLDDGDEARRALARAKQIVEKQDIARLAAMYHATAAGIAARSANYRVAYEETKAMAEKQRAAVQANNRQELESQKIRFEVVRKDAENALLRAQQLEAEARRANFATILVLAGAVLIGIVASLWLQIRQKRRFANLALRDELTGAPNRRSMLALLQPRRHGGRTMIAILDIDHFKQVNDLFGHDVGDVVLRAFYETCRSCLRGSDVLGRWGGEEFLLIGDGSSERDISALFRRILNAVEKVQAPGLPPEYRLSFSMGVSHFEPGATGLEEALKRADAALYEAKIAGRSRHVYDRYIECPA